MIKCPWCGTAHLTFQSNCQNCGGPLRTSDEKYSSSVMHESLPTPPPAPRPIPNSYAWKLFFQDGGAIAGMVFAILGFIFSLVGAGLTIAVITAFLGIPFLVLGIAFLLAGVWVFSWRYQHVRKVVKVLQIGLAREGQVVALEQNFHLRFKGLHPWVIKYKFQVQGQDFEGKASALIQPGEHYQAGNSVWILYLPDSPKWNSIYPHP